MKSVEYWQSAKKYSINSKYKFLIESFLWIIPSIFVIYMVINSDLFIVAMVSATVFSLLMIKDAYKRYQKRHQKHILPKLLGDEFPLQFDPSSGISLMVIEPSRLFPGAEKVNTKTYIRGHVAGFNIELSELDLTRLKIKRKVRKIQKPVFSGVCFAIDLGKPVCNGNIHIYGSRNRRTWKDIRLNRDLPRQIVFGTGFGVRLFGNLGTRKIWTSQARQELKKLMKLQPMARISIFNNRHMVVAIPYEKRMFKSAGVFFTPTKDPYIAKTINTMNQIARLSAALGGRQSSDNFKIIDEVLPKGNRVEEVRSFIKDKINRIINSIKYGNSIVKKYFN